MKSSVLVAVSLPICTVIFPVVAPAGTVVTMLVVVAEVMVVTGTPLNFTMLLAAVVLKPKPVMVTVLLTAPLVGVKLVIFNSPTINRGPVAV